MIWIKRFFYSLFLVFCFYFVIVSSGSSLLEFFDLPSAILVFGGLIFGLSHFRLSHIFQAFALALGQGELESESYSLSRQILKTLGNYPVWAGGLGTVVGIVQSLGNLDEVSALGAGLAISLLSLLYGLFFKLLVFYPFLVALERQALDLNLSAEVI